MVGVALFLQSKDFASFIAAIGVLKTVSPDVIKLDRNI